MNTATLLELDANDPIWDDVWHLVRKRLMQVDTPRMGKHPIASQRTVCGHWSNSTTTNIFSKGRSAAMPDLTPL